MMSFLLNLHMFSKPTLILVFLASTVTWHAASRVSLAQNRDVGEQLGLKLQFADDFTGELDLRRWIVREGKCKTENGCLRMDATRPPPPGPGRRVASNLDLKEKCFAPGLVGDNGVEITLKECRHERNYPKDLEAKIVRDDKMDWAISLCSWRGLIGGEKSTDRGVQLHFSWMGPHGIYVCFVRGLLPEDFKKYPNDDIWRSKVEDWWIREDKLIEEGAFVSEPCMVMAIRVFRPGHKFLEDSHRWGLYLTDDGKTAYWTLDGRKMDSFDVSDYFSSSPEAIKDGLYLTIQGSGVFQENLFKMDDLKVYTSDKASRKD